MARTAVPPFPIRKEDIEQVTENPNQVVSVRVHWVRDILFSASLEDEERLGLDIHDLERRVVPDTPGILMGDKEVPVTLAEKAEIEALCKALEWLRETGIVEPPRYLPEHEGSYRKLVEMGKMKDSFDAYVAAVKAEISAPPSNTSLSPHYSAESDAAAAEALSRLKLQ